MASWVITIRGDRRQHWNYARKHGLWDMPKNFPVREGDLVYFRLGGGALISQCRATSDARPLTDADMVPWDDGRDPYTTRFTFRLLSDRPLIEEAWSVTAARLSTAPVLQVPRSWGDPADETVLASYFELPDQPLTPLEAAALSMLEEAGALPLDTGTLTEDERKVVLTLQAVRQGQEAFRKKLIAIYRACAITGTTVETTLDAAHIRRYSGPKSNVIPNGLILRGDLHRLFDRYLLTIMPDYLVRVSPELRGTTYGGLDNQLLEVIPTQVVHRPHGDLLREHNSKCAWLDW